MLFLTVASSSGAALAQLYPGGPVDPRDIIDQLDNSTDANLEVEGTTYYKLCEIRRFFCGGTQTAMAGAAIFIVGLLTIIGKMNWQTVIIIMVGIAIFTSAELVAETLTSFPPTVGVVYSCYCINNFTHLLSF